MDIEVPQDRLSEFEPQVVKKRQKDISDYRPKDYFHVCKGIKHKVNFIEGHHLQKKFHTLLSCGQMLHVDTYNG